jgi:hypothetical protein
MTNLFGSFYNKEDRYQQKQLYQNPPKKEKKRSLYLGFKVCDIQLKELIQMCTTTSRKNKLG